jgi:hypothetical protein
MIEYKIYKWHIHPTKGRTDIGDAVHGLVGKAEGQHRESFLCSPSCLHRLRGLNKLLSSGIGKQNARLHLVPTLKQILWRCAFTCPSTLIAWCYINKSLFRFNPFLSRDKILKGFGIQWICSHRVKLSSFLCFTLKVNLFRALESAYLVTTNRRCHTRRLESKSALVWEPKKSHFTCWFGYLYYNQELFHLVWSVSWERFGSSSNTIPEGPRKTSETVSQGSQSSGRYLNPAPPSTKQLWFSFDRGVSRLLKKSVRGASHYVVWSVC